MNVRSLRNQKECRGGKRHSVAAKAYYKMSCVESRRTGRTRELRVARRLNRSLNELAFEQRLADGYRSPVAVRFIRDTLPPSVNHAPKNASQEFGTGDHCQARSAALPRFESRFKLEQSVLLLAAAQHDDCLAG